MRDFKVSKYFVRNYLNQKNSSPTDQAEKELQKVLTIQAKKFCDQCIFIAKKRKVIKLHKKDRTRVCKEDVQIIKKDGRIN